jgi:glycosyltransferase involved in cell wall biosynthesis
MAQLPASVIIPTCNNDLRLVWVLEGLCLQDYPSFEVIVVNDAGSDSTESLVLGFSYRLRIRYFMLGGSKSESRSGAARNLGAKHSYGARLIFLDSDMVPDPDLVSAHTIGVDANIALYGFRRSYPVNSVSPFRPPFSYSKLLSLSVPDARLANYINWEMPQLYFHFLSCNYSLASDVFCALGGHDERFVGWGGEDIDLGFRITRAGYCIQALWGRGMATHLDHPLQPLAINPRPWYLSVTEPLCRNGGRLVKLIE